MPRPSKTAQEEGFIRSFWEELRTMEADHHGTGTVNIYPSKRPGVLTIRMVFTPTLAGEEHHLGTQAVQYDFPGPYNQSFAGSLWLFAGKLHDLAALAWQDKYNGEHST